MIYSPSAKMWCVHPTRHTNYIDVVNWCTSIWGYHKIDQVCDGVWSYCDGVYYGLKKPLGKLIVDDTRLFFSFVRQEDAIFLFVKVDLTFTPIHV